MSRHLQSETMARRRGYRWHARLRSAGGVTVVQPLTQRNRRGIGGPVATDVDGKSMYLFYNSWVPTAAFFVFTRDVSGGITPLT